MRLGLGLGLTQQGGGEAAATAQVLFVMGQSYTTWARSDIAEIPVADRPTLTTANVEIWNVATQAWVQHKSGPLSGGGNEQQPGNSWLDSAYQNGIGFDWALVEALALKGVVDLSKPLKIFRFTRGGSTFRDNLAWTTDGDWRKTTSGGAYADMLVEWTAAEAALTQTVNPIAMICDLGLSTAGDTTNNSYTTYDTDMATFISNVRADVIGSTCPWYQLRIPNISPFSGYAGYSDVRGDQEALASSTFKLVNLDGIALEFDSSFPTDDHPVAGSMEMYGRNIGLDIAGVAYPLQELQAAGDTHYAIRNWKPGSLETWNADNPPSEYPFVTFDRALGPGDMVSVNAGDVPTLETTTLANGIQRRAVVCDGVSDVFFGGAPPCINNSGGFLLYGAFKCVAGANEAIYSEGNTGTATPGWGFTTDATGNACLILRDDAGNLIYIEEDLGVGLIADGNWHYFGLAYDESNFRAYMDGTTGPDKAWTKAAITVNRAGFGARHWGAAPAGHSNSTIGEMTVCNLGGSLSAAMTKIAAMREYHQIHYGTP